MSFNFTTKVNAKTLVNPDIIVNEAHTAQLGDTFVKLIEVPAPGSVSIPGYSETTSPVPALNQFMVDYATGYLTFNSSQFFAPTTLQVSYTGLGSIVDAVDINAVQDAINSISAGGGVINAISASFSTNLTVGNDASIDNILFVGTSLVLTPQTSTPPSPQAGEIWFDQASSQFLGYTGSAIVVIG